MKTIKLLIVIFIVSIALYSFDQYDQKEWDIPEKYVKMKNPTY